MCRSQIPHLNEEVGYHLFVMDNESQRWGHEGGEISVSTIIAFQPKEQAMILLWANQTDVTLYKALEGVFKLSQQ